MKLISLLVLTLIFQTAHACDENSSASDCKDSDATTEKSDIEFEKRRLKTLAGRMCFQLQSSRTSGHDNTGERVENIMLKHLKITRETKDYKLLVSKFWNDNAQNLICDNDADGLRNPEQFMKRVISMDMHTSALYDFLLLDEEEYPVTVNHIEIYQGKEETVLDYIENILNIPSNSTKFDFVEIESLKDVLIEDYGAKYAKDL